ncbi:MAG: phosphatase PAP2-related protein [Mucilaginibacter sp.]
MSIKENWKETISNTSDRVKLIIGSVLIFIILALMPQFFNKIEKRNGVVLHDWVLAAIPPHNVSVAIFIVIWGMGLFVLYRALYKPRIYILYIWSMVVVCLVRMATISFVALNPPIGLIPLADPLTGIFYGEASITKDLFFSGHIATLTLIFLCLDKKSDKMIALGAIVTVACLLLVQHIHYSIDILASPIITYICFRLAKYSLF